MHTRRERRSGRPGRGGAGLVLLVGLTGCSMSINHFRETGPSAEMAWDSPTTADVKTRFEPGPARHRDWEATTVAAESGIVRHWPLYTEDPFEDKGHGRTDATDPHNVYRYGWEDFVALAYCPARFTLNWLALPVSAVVTPPWTIMESDGFLSRQALGYDHDASRATTAEPAPPPAAATTPPAAQ